MSRELFLKVTGRVQGVFFRQNCQKEAERLKLTGFAKNLPDGSVEVLAQGDEKILRSFLNFVRVGPGYAVVQTVDEQWRNVGKPYSEFSKI